MVSGDAPARGHPLRLGLLPNPTSFKSCPREGASPDSYQKTIGFPFQVIPREGGIKENRVFAVGRHSFKPFPREGASKSALGQLFVPLFQVIPPRGGIAVGVRDRRPDIHVSSHAPVRGHHVEMVAATVLKKFQVMPPRGGIPAFIICKLIEA